MCDFSYNSWTNSILNISNYAYKKLNVLVIATSLLCVVWFYVIYEEAEKGTNGVKVGGRQRRCRESGR